MFRNLRAVVVFEYLNVVRRKSYIISLIVSALVILIISLLPLIVSWIQSDIETGINYGSAAFADDSGYFDMHIISLHFPEYEWLISDAAELTEKVEEGAVAFAIHIISADSYVIYTTNPSLAPTVSVTTELMRVGFQSRRLSEIGINEAVIRQIVDISITESRHILQLAHGDGAPETDPLAGALGSLIMIAVFITVSASSAMISSSITAEKTTKTIELLFISAKPTIIVTGKVLASILIVLTTYIFMLFAGIIIFLGPGIIAGISAAADMELSAGSPLLTLAAEHGIDINFQVSLYVYMLLFMICGLVSFAFLNAGFAATVRDAQEGASLLIIPQFLLMGAYFLSVFLPNMPGVNQTIINTLSYIPFISPFFMIVRIAAQTMYSSQILLILGLNALYMIIFALISAKIYKMCIMLFGHKITFGFLVKKLIKG